MKWMPGRMALVTAVGFLALVGGVGYVVHPSADRTTLAASVATSGASPSTGPSSSAQSSALPSAQSSVLPTAQPSALPSARPSATATPEPSGKPRTTPSATPGQRLPPKRLPKPTPLPPPTLDFVLSSFNVLGASHTSGSGKRPGMASGHARARGAAELIRRHDADVIGFQELQGSQLASLERHTALDFYPGSALRRQDSENSIGWRRDRWTAVERHTVRIPYFNGGARAMPFVRLRSNSTGIEAWFANFHNPAETAQYHHQQRYRTEATRIEIALANRLITTTGLPVFLTGDMNERASYFCRFTAGTPMVAARGGTHTGRCLAGRPRAVDWIFGSQGVQFTGYFEDRSHLVDITTDHPVVVARVHLVGKTATS